MKEYNLTTKMRAYQWDELTDEQREVLEMAKEQTKHSYCPYSGFHFDTRLQSGERGLPERIMRGAHSLIRCRRTISGPTGDALGNSVLHGRAFHQRARFALRRVPASDDRDRAPLRRKDGSAVVWRRRYMGL